MFEHLPYPVISKPLPFTVIFISFSGNCSLRLFHDRLSLPYNTSGYHLTYLLYTYYTATLQLPLHSVSIFTIFISISIFSSYHICPVSGLSSIHVFYYIDNTLTSYSRFITINLLFCHSFHAHITTSNPIQ